MHRVPFPITEKKDLSTALGVLIGALKRLRQAGGDLVLQSPSSGDSMVLEMTGLNQVFQIHTS